MAPTPTPGGGQNQTLLELIYALKGLAQTVEFYHKDLSQRLDDEANARTRELESLRSLIGKTNQAVTVLPITMSDRVEKLLGQVTTNVNDQFEDVAGAITEVRQKLFQYMRVTDRAISQNEGTIPEPVDEKAEITGRLEVTKAGNVRLQINSVLLRRLWQAAILAAAGGGLYGLKEFVSSLLGH